MKVLSYSEHNKSNELTQIFLSIIGSDTLNESDESYKVVLKKIVSDLKLNGSLSLTFGAGMTSMFPLVAKLVTNMSMKIDITPETIVLMTIAAVTIAHLEEQKQLKNREEVEKDAKSILEELKLRGIGNGIIKKLVKCVQSVTSIFNLLFRHKRHVANGLMDMFAYAALSTPIINAALYMIGKYQLTIDTLPANFLSIGLGVTTLIAKHGIRYIINLLKDKIKLDEIDILGSDHSDDPLITKYPHPEFIDSEFDSKDSKLIKEQ